MTYGTYRSAAEAVNKFVYDELIDAALDPDPPETLNVPQQFASFLVAAQFNRLVAEEEAERHRKLLRFRLKAAINQWLDVGLPAPIGYADNLDVVLTWKHASYAEITGHEPLSLGFVETYEWLTSLEPRDFLFPCATFLKIVGCDPIFITDGSGDEGIDCIGRIADGPIRSIFLFVQCKTRKEGAKKFIGKDVLYQEYGKYATLPKTEKYQEYLRALNFAKALDGSANVYVLISNGEFENNAQVVARNLGILLRSVRQLAYFLSANSTPEQLKDLKSRITIPRGPDLQKNFAPEIQLN